MFYSVFEKKHCVLPFFALTKNIIALKTFIFNVFRVRWGITVYQNCFPKYILQHRVADRSGFNRKSSTIIGHSTPNQDDWLSQLYFSLSTCLVRTLERAQESGKAAPSAQTTMDPEIPLSWEFNWLLNTLPVSVRELSSFRTAPQAKNLYVQLPKTLRKHCFELPKSHCGSVNR